MMPEEIAISVNTESRPANAIWVGRWPHTREEFERFIEVFLDRLVWYAFRRLGNLEEAEDVVQDAFVKAFADREKLRRVRQVGPYIYRMVANACAEHRGRRKTLSLDELGPEDIPGNEGKVSQQIAAADELQRIEQYLRRLPGRQAEVIRLRVLDGLSLSDIAEIVGCSLATAKSRFRYGLQKLRRIVPHAKEES